MELRNLLFFLILFSLAFHCDYVAAISGPGKMVKLDFEPGMVHTEKYPFWGAERIGIRLSEDLAPYATLHDPNPEGGPREISVDFKLPQEMPHPGRWTLGIVATDIGPVGGGMAAIAQIVVELFVYVPFPGKYLYVTISASDVEQNETAKSKISLISRGDEDITGASLDFEVVNEINESVYQTTKKLATLFAKKTIVEEMEFETNGILPGPHKAIATVSYDGKQTSSYDGFKIGDLDVGLLSFTNSLPPGGISMMIIRLESKWREMLPVYAEVYIDGKKVGTSPTIQMGEFKEGTIESYVDLNGFSKGEHELIIRTFFGNRQKDFKSTLSLVVSKPQEESPNGVPTMVLIVVGLSIFLLLATIGVLIALLIKHKS
jgi:hypothetical protein